MTDSGADALRREMELLAGEIKSAMQFGGTVQGLTKRLIAIYEMGCASQKRRDAAKCLAQSDSECIEESEADWARGYTAACEHCAEAIEAGDHT